MKRRAAAAMGAMFGGGIVASSMFPLGTGVYEFAWTGMLTLSGAAVMGSGSYIAADLWLEGHQGGEQA